MQTPRPSAALPTGKHINRGASGGEVILNSTGFLPLLPLYQHKIASLTPQLWPPNNPNASST
jgi:hypothetical protein